MSTLKSHTFKNYDQISSVTVELKELYFILEIKYSKVRLLEHFNEQASYLKFTSKSTNLLPEAAHGYLHLAFSLARNFSFGPWTPHFQDNKLATKSITELEAGFYLNMVDKQVFLLPENKVEEHANRWIGWKGDFQNNFTLTYY